VLGLAILLRGGAGLASDGARAAAPIEIRYGRGAFQVWKGRAGLVIGAPHGTSDSHTDLIGRDLARLTGLSLVVATGFSHLDAGGRRLNVNRPTESVPGTPARLEEGSAEARQIYEVYRRLVGEAAQGPVRLYVEVHGNGHRSSAGRVEIATVGIGRDAAARLKALFERVRDTRLAGDAGAPRLEVWVEAVDPLRYTASAAKQSGVLGAADRALHVELPRVARTTSREIYTAILADVLLQAGLLLAGGVP
jgi:hypothetical protein